MNNTDAWQRVHRILAVRLDHFGDVLMTTPALSAIRAHRPNAHLALWCAPASVEVAQASGLIDEVLPFKAPWMKHAAPDALSAGLYQISQSRFEAAVIFTACTQSALPAATVCAMAHIPLRLAHAREQPYHLLTHWVRDQEQIQVGMRHEVTRQLDLVAELGWAPPHDRLHFQRSQSHEENVSLLLRTEGLADNRPYIVMHPGATAPSRRYPAERFGALADALWRSHGLRTVFTGLADDRVLIDLARVGRNSPSIDLSGRLSVGELGEVIARGSLLVSNNTGPVHLAAALATPVVDLYALTNPQHTPWRAPAKVLYKDVPCRHCLQSACPQAHHDCLRGIDDQLVLKACLDLLPA